MSVPKKGLSFEIIPGGGGSKEPKVLKHRFVEETNWEGGVSCMFPNEQCCFVVGTSLSEGLQDVQNPFGLKALQKLPVSGNPQEKRGG